MRDRVFMLSHTGGSLHVLLLSCGFAYSKFESIGQFHRQLQLKL